MGAPKQQGQCRTRIRLAKARDLMSSGWGDRDIVSKLAEDYGVSRKSARRTLKAALLVEEQSLDHRRRTSLGKQIAKCERAQRMALEAVERYASQGIVMEEVASPDLRAFLAAVQEQNKLLGMYQAELAGKGGGEWEGALVVVERDPQASEDSDEETPARMNGTNGHVQPAPPPSPFTPPKLDS